MQNVLSHLSDIIIPAVIFYMVSYGLVTRTPVYEAFLEGAAKGLKVVADILPTLIGLMVAVGVLRASGFLTFLGELLSPLGSFLRVPSQVFPLLIIKMFSSSAATGLVLDIFRECGTDSYAGILTSLLMSCTETLFYTMSVYYMSAKVTKTRYTLPGALIATLAGTIMSVLLAGRLL